MKIFYKRPLSLILCISLGGFVLFAIGSAALRISSLVIAFLLFFFSYFLKGFKKESTLLLRICSLSLILASLLSFLYFDLWFNAAERFGQEVTVTGKVTAIDFEDYTKTIDIKTTSIDDKPLTRYKMRAIIDSDDTTNVSIGSMVSFTAKISNFDSYGNGFDAKLYYNSRGYSGIFTDVHSFNFIEPGNFTLSYKIDSYRDSLCRRIISHSDQNSGGLLCALLFGERDYLSPAIELSFSRLGITHILALSGMHLVFLCAGLGKILSLFGVNKKWRKISEIIFTSAYVAFTGFSVSVVRSGIMLLISSLLFLFSRSKDSVTSLFIAVTLICAVMPYSILDISLWLSAFATLGIVSLSEAKSQTTTYNRRIPKILILLKDSWLISMFAIAATLAISASTFNEISLVAPLTTIIFSALSEIFMYAGTVFIIICNFQPFGRFIRFFGWLITELASAISSMKWLFVSTDFLFTKIAITLLTILFFAFLIIDIKHKKAATVSLCAILVSIFAISGFCSYFTEQRLNFDYVLSNSDERIVLSDNGETAVIDITDANISTAYESVSLIKSLRLTNAEKYIYTRYSKAIVNAIDSLLGAILIDEVYVPLPTNEEEEKIRVDILSIAEKHNTKIVFYSESDIIDVSDTFKIFPVYYSSKNQTKNAFCILYNENFYTYLSSGILSSTTAPDALPLIDGCHTLILGKCGNAYSNYRFIYKSENMKNLIISSKGVYIPEETREFYKDTQIYFSPKYITLK